MADLDSLVRPLHSKDLRVLLRARGCNPAGGDVELKQRLKENMIATGNYSVSVDGQAPPPVYAGASTNDMKQGSLMNNYSRPGGQQNVGNFLTDKPSSRVLAPPGGGSQVMFGDYSDPHTRMQKSPAQGGGYGQAPPSYQQSPPPYQQQAPMGYQPNAQYQQAPPPGYQVRPTQQYGGPPPGQPQPGYGMQDGSQVMFGASSSDTRNGTLSNNYARPGGQQNVGNFLTDRPSSRVLAPPGGKSQISFG